MRRLLEEFYYGSLNPCNQQFLRGQIMPMR